jgi:hypothetical protein
VIRLYIDVAKLASKRALAAWPVAFSVLIYGAILLAAAQLFGGIPMIGGMIIGLILAGCVSSYITLLENTVGGHKSKWADLKTGFGTRFWDVISVMFAFWIIGFASSTVVSSAGPQGVAMQAIISITIAVFFNTVPELLYQGGSRSFGLLMDSARFVTKHWTTWLPPNLLFAALALAPTGALSVQHPGDLILRFADVFSVTGLMMLLQRLPLWMWPLLLLWLHFAMVYRGILYKELSHSNPRLRAFQAAQR